MHWRKDRTPAKSQLDEPSTNSKPSDLQGPGETGWVQLQESKPQDGLCRRPGRKERIYALTKILAICVFVLVGMYSLRKIWKSDTSTVFPEVASYFQEAIDIMEENFIYRDRVDWDLVKQKSYEQIGRGTSLKNAYSGIQLALSLIEDNHSFFLPPDTIEVLEKNDRLDLAKAPSYSLIRGDIAYLALFGLGSISGVVSREYTQQIQTAIRELDRHCLDKWIIDLRDDTGGNMWPMLLGTGPLLGEGLMGFFIDKDGEKIGWYYENGRVRVGDCVLESTDNPYMLKMHPRIAVLVGGKTASAGEAVAIAFSGKQNVRSFGQQTAGFTSCNELYRLRDGAGIALTTRQFSNCSGTSFPGGLIPNECIPPIEGKDPSMEAAVNWLRRRMEHIPFVNLP